jgi:hypothetical protein
MGAAKSTKPRDPSLPTAKGRCVCGAVHVEIGVPARWAWHDHSVASRLAQGAAYATYVGCYKSRFWVTKGEAGITRFADEKAGTVRGFCARCGTPILYERLRSHTMVNVPRALFTTRTGREARYHMNLEQIADWTWQGEPLGPLKGYPGVMWERPRRKKKSAAIDDFL